MGYTTANQRIPVLVSPEKKRRIHQCPRSRAVHGRIPAPRRAATAYSPREDEAVLSAMIDQMVRATEQAEAAIDEALEFVAASEERIRRMEEATRQGRAD